MPYPSQRRRQGQRILAVGLELWETKVRGGWETSLLMMSDHKIGAEV